MNSFHNTENKSAQDNIFILECGFILGTESVTISSSKFDRSIFGMHLQKVYVRANCPDRNSSFFN